MAAAVATVAGANPTDKRFPNAPAGYDIVSFAVDFLNSIGAPVTPGNVGAIVAWANLESGGYNPSVAGGANNPLNIVTTPGDGHSGQGGSQGDIADFPNPATAIRAYKNFWLPKTNIVNAFRSDAGIPAISSAVNSFYGSWGSSISFSGAGGINPSTGQETSAAGDLGTVGATATTTGVSLNPVTDLQNIAAKIAGVGIGGALGPFFDVFGGVKKAVLLGGQALAGMVFITLGIIIILVDAGGGYKGPIPIPV